MIGRAEEHFSQELGLINDPVVTLVVARMLNDGAPEYFWHVPTSPTGKHHPKDEQVHGGLVLHTRRVAKIAEDLCRAFQITGRNRDITIAACLIHDMFCRGLDDEPTPNTYNDHEAVPEKNLYSRVSSKEAVNSIHDRDWYAAFNDITYTARAHAGRWGPASIDTQEQLIVHLADYTASRRYIYIDVNERES